MFDSRLSTFAVEDTAALSLRFHESVHIVGLIGTQNGIYRELLVVCQVAGWHSCGIHLSAQ